MESSPHVVILPFPAQGHIKLMLMLAELLSRAGFTISFINNEQNHRRLHSNFNAAFRPGINFFSIADGLPADHPRSGLSLIDLLISTSTVCKPYFEELIASMRHAPSCIIADGIMSFAVEVAAELGIPAIAFRTYSATSTWTYFHLDKLIEEGEIPVVQANMELKDVTNHHNTMSSAPPPLPPAAHIHRHPFHVAFYWGKEAYFLFPGWPDNKSGMYGVSLVFVFALAILAEFLSNLNLVKPGSNRAAAIFFQTGFHAARAGFSYLVMLAVMSYNGGVFIAAVLGHAVGYVMFGSRLRKGERPN